MNPTSPRGSQGWPRLERLADRQFATNESFNRREPGQTAPSNLVDAAILALFGADLGPVQMSSGGRPELPDLPDVTSLAPIRQPLGTAVDLTAPSVVSVAGRVGASAQAIHSEIAIDQVLMEDADTIGLDNALLRLLAGRRFRFGLSHSIEIEKDTDGLLRPKRTRRQSQGTPHCRPPQVRGGEADKVARAGVTRGKAEIALDAVGSRARPTRRAECYVGTSRFFDG